MTILIKNSLVEIQLAPKTNLKMSDTTGNKNGFLFHAQSTPVAMYGLDGYDALISGNGDDYLDGGSGDDELWGSGGNDTLIGGLGNDTLVGGTGDDTYLVDSLGDIVLEYRNQGNDTVISSVDFRSFGNIEKIVLIGTARSIEAHSGSELLIGNQENNRITAYSGNDTLLGGAGKDTLLGDHGNDILVGGADNDSLVGGTGNDSFVFDSGSPFRAVDLGIDTISDFEVNADRIALSRTTFTKLGSSITFENVASRELAEKSSALIVYARNTGGLYYNENGTTAGLGAGEQFATLTANLSGLSASNFIFSETIKINL
jgi:Ca2+-binding RTX toxin-like protein